MKKIILILAAFFINHDSYANSPEWKEAKMSHVEQMAARMHVEKELRLTMDSLLDLGVSDSCREQSSDNAIVIGGEDVSRTQAESKEGLLGKIARNEVTTKEVDEALTHLSATRMTMCALAYLPPGLN